MNGTLKTHFINRQELIEYVEQLAPWAVGEASTICGGAKHADQAVANINPIEYGKTRNFGHGKVTQLSPYIHHGIIDINEIRNEALHRCCDSKKITKFIQELSWRDFWHRIAAQNPHWIWNDVEPYKTGFDPQEYQDFLPQDIINGSTGVACIDAFIATLLQTGYLHNHARMYVASYIVHFRRIKWQAGAQWFLEHLLDGDEASNNFSWQWVASTFSHKPYIFNLENVHRYFSTMVDTNPDNNMILNASYEQLTMKLFPYLRVGQHE